jgi:hypothetical protein
MSKRAILYFASKRTDALKRHVLSHYQASVTGNLLIGFHRARAGVFDAYVIHDKRDGSRSAFAWQEIRAFDANTPFVFISSNCTDERARAQMRPHYETLVAPHPPRDVLGAVDSMIAMAEQRSSGAAIAALDAAQRELCRRMQQHAVPNDRHRGSAAFAYLRQEMLRPVAFREYVLRGGTRAAFERWWPEALGVLAREAEI